MRGAAWFFVVIGAILCIWLYIWGRTGFYESQSGAMAVLGLAGLGCLIVSVILFNRVRAAARLTQAEGMVFVRPTAVAPSEAPAVAIDPLRAAAANPATPLATLADLAYNHPQLRALVAANPSAYPGLIDWLRQFDDDDIGRAIAARSDS